MGVGGGRGYRGGGDCYCLDYRLATSGSWIECVSVITSSEALANECGYMTTLCSGNTDERSAFYSSKAK